MNIDIRYNKVRRNKFNLIRQEETKWPIPYKVLDTLAKGK